MFGTIVHSEWTSVTNEGSSTFRLELQREGFDGESREVRMREGYMDHNYQNLNMREPFKNTILKGDLTMPLSMELEDDIELVESVFDADPRTHRIVKYVDNELDWIGYVDISQLEYPRADRPIAGSVKSRDLDELRAEDYGFLEGRQRIIKVIADILASLDYDLPIRTYTSWKESDMDDTDDFLNERYIDRYVLRIYGRGGEPDESISKYEALERVLKPFKLFIIQSDGYWHLFQISALENADNIFEFEYEPDGEQVVES